MRALCITLMSLAAEVGLGFAQTPNLIPLPAYRRVGAPASNEELQRTYARCKITAQGATQAVVDASRRLAEWIAVRDNCMSAEGWIRSR